MKVTKNMPIKKLYFGAIGKHYDFMVSVVGKHKWGLDYFVAGDNHSGCKMLFRVMNHENWIEFKVGDDIVIRGQVLAHDMLFGEPITYIETSLAPSRIEAVKNIV